MAELKSYDVVINKMRTVVKLSDADAKKRGLTEDNLVKPARKGRTAANKGGAATGNKAGGDTAKDDGGGKSDDSGKSGS